MTARAELAAVGDILNAQLGEGGVDYGVLGDASRRLRSLNMTVEAGAARASGEAAEEALSLLQTLRALRGVLDALIDANRATWDTLALLAIMVEIAAEALGEKPVAAEMPEAPPAVAGATAYAVRDLARAHRKRFEYFGRRMDSLVADHLEQLAAALDAPPPGPSANFVRFPAGAA